MVCVLHGSGIGTRRLLDISAAGATCYAFIKHSWIAEISSLEHLNKLLSVSAGTGEVADDRFFNR